MMNRGMNKRKLGKQSRSEGVINSNIIIVALHYQHKPYVGIILRVRVSLVDSHTHSVEQHVPPRLCYPVLSLIEKYEFDS
jgi:hypothetical protein